MDDDTDEDEREPKYTFGEVCDIIFGDYSNHVKYDVCKMKRGEKEKTAYERYIA